MLYDQINEAITYLQTQTEFQPRYGIILGTGLSKLTDEMEVDIAIPYRFIPHFPVSTVESHKGQLIFGKLDGVPVVAMAGRFHYYEGYTMQQVTFPVRVMKGLGIRHLFISNAAGGTNAEYQAGDIVLVRDHINLQPDNPLRGANDERLGPRFPDMLHTYDRILNGKALGIARKHDIRAHEGVYVALPGPNLETPAEYNFLHTIGGDLVGMSTVPEVLVARHSGLDLTVMSVVTNRCFPISEIKETSVSDVIAVAQAAEPRMRTILGGLLRELEGDL
ncbi:purine-nucleoside phosphorylase [Flavilitoribacter nigricans]|uniref:Purine nucleoside phosphorylase n=1 Tax=Flavilitoribacter nigricans (strain ATCC 23147 / DSM 23189 / NBRC 102662 / NCIMB 1420 / SS-2) TaxID=1122177 RepID=A0A2D0N6H4_FLAN2|nr:purine-nucleoside phosphorylase [Flavilitoribacter nigricans]PHN03990.1 purine-nucleoside phosphorylase [Flavilitoribacter nigricans DSM 23189 = NBRC 102662]